MKFITSVCMYFKAKKSRHHWSDTPNYEFVGKYFPYYINVDTEI